MRLSPFTSMAVPSPGSYTCLPDAVMERDVVLVVFLWPGDVLENADMLDLWLVEAKSLHCM